MSPIMIVNLMMLIAMVGIMISLVAVLNSLLKVVHAVMYLSNRMDLKGFTEYIAKLKEEEDDQEVRSR